MSKFWQLCKKYRFWLIWTLLTIIFIPIAFCITTKYQSSTRGLAFLLGSPLIIVGLYLASKRTKALEYQNATDSKRLVTETFAKSIELLGHEKEAVRQGAIYALGKIADTNSEELIVVNNTLCAFIRHNQNTLTSTSKEGLPIDIEAAVKVISKISNKLERTQSGKHDLSNISLQYADFSNANLSRFNLSDSDFKSCIFEKVKFFNSNLVGSTFTGSDFDGAKFNDKTEVQKADFSDVINLDPQQINKAQGNKEAKLPKVLDK